MNALWPIIVIGAGAFGVWFCRYLNAPRPFEVAIVAVVILLVVVWLLTVFGGVDLAVPRVDVD